MFAAMPDELGADGGYRQAGWFFLIPPDFLAGATANVAMQQKVGVDTRLLDDKEIAEMMPWLNPEGVAGVAHERKGGYADPVQSTEAYLKAFKDLGGEARIGSAARSIMRSGDKVTGVITDDGPITSGAIVNATGPWSALLANSAGIELDLKVLREQDNSLGGSWRSPTANKLHIERGRCNICPAAWRSPICRWPRISERIFRSGSEQL